jgi:hypothetical protein
MRYLILSDIHANATALEAALEAAKGRWDKVLCLGDVVGYGPDPNEVIDKVRELGATTIRGNHGISCGLKTAYGWRSCRPVPQRWTDSRWFTARIATKMNMFLRRRKLWTDCSTRLHKLHSSDTHTCRAVSPYEIIKWACCTLNQRATPSFQR